MYNFVRGEICVDVRTGDILEMKKAHPGCGSSRMKVIRAGADFKLSCIGCGHMIMIARSKCEKNIKAVIHGETDKKP